MRTDRSELQIAAGAALVGAAAGAGLLSLVWTPYAPAALDMAARLQPPSRLHLLGTDPYGRDIVSQLMAGARTALAISAAASVGGLGLGAPWGLLAAQQRGWAEEVLMRASDLLFAFPAVLVAILAAAWLGPGELDAVLAIGLASAPVFARVVRAAALRLWSLDFTLAARAAGRSRWAVTLAHVLPNLLPALIVQLALQLSLAVVAEAGLAFLGLSAQPPQPSWGRMLADAQTYGATAPWLVLAPGGAIVATVLGFGMLGEGLRRRLAAVSP